MAHNWVTLHADLKGLPLYRKCLNCKKEQGYERYGEPGKYEYRWAPLVGRCKEDEYINWREFLNDTTETNRCS